MLLLRNVNDCRKAVNPRIAVNRNPKLTILILKDMVEPNLLTPSVFRA